MSEVNQEFAAFVRQRRARKMMIYNARHRAKLAKMKAPNARDVHKVAFEIMNNAVPERKAEALLRHMVAVLVDRGFSDQVSRGVVKRMMDAPFNVDTRSHDRT